MPPDPLRVACFRFERISPLLDEGLTPAERRRYMRSWAREPVQWPSGHWRRASERTLARWYAAWRTDPRIESLLPKPRAPSSPGGRTLDPELVRYALALLEQEPARSLYVLQVHLKLKFGLAHPPARATLHRALSAHTRYQALRKRARGEGRIRKRFQAVRPHQIWQVDAKGPFTVAFTDGTRRNVHVLTILDDHTRAVMAACVVRSESLAAAVHTFRQAAARWGLPEGLYADLGSCYDADPMRSGLSILGVRRIGTRPRNPAAHGKIEAYHRSLTRWFVVELRHQPIGDMTHLQALLEAFVHVLYQPHHHDELGMSPQQALAGRRSARSVSVERLTEAFLDPRSCAVCPRTATVKIEGTRFRLPDACRYKKRLTVLIDPEQPDTPYLRNASGALDALAPALTRRAAPSTPNERAASVGHEPVGPLTPLLEVYRGRILPKAYPGFGLPEIYEAFSRVLERPVPLDEGEARAMVAFLEHGPFEPKAFHKALEATLRVLGPGRPLRLLLDRLAQTIRPNPPKEKRP